MELLVAMVISGIVISLGYGIFSMMQKHYRELHESAVGDRDLVSAVSVLELDAFRCQAIVVKEENTVIMKWENKEVLYHFLPDMLVRTEGDVSDSLQLPAYELKLSAGGIGCTMPGEWIDAIRFSIHEEENESLGYTINKHYSALEKIEAEQRKKQTNP